MKKAVKATKIGRKEKYLLFDPVEFLGIAKYHKPLNFKELE